MRHLLLAATTSTTVFPAMPSAPSSSISKPKSLNQNPNPKSHASLCKRLPSATLDILILIIVLCSVTFLITSYFSYICHSLSILLSQSSLHLHHLPIPYILGFVFFFAVSFFLVEFYCGAQTRKCDRPGCKGLKKALEFELKLQEKHSLKSASQDIDSLPWKGSTETNPDYECLRAELRKVAPRNGRAVLLFRARCGCPVAKLEGWGPKRGKRNKKSRSNIATDGGGGHC